VKTSLHCVKTSLHCVKTSLHCVKTGLHCVKTGLHPALPEATSWRGNRKYVSYFYYSRCVKSRRRLDSDAEAGILREKWVRNDF
jgi:hypothetical protein